PDPGEPRPRSPKGPEPRESRQHLAQSDAVPHDPDVVHDVHGLGRPLPVRGGSASGLCLRARRGCGARHLLDGGRRVADRGLGDVEPRPPERAAEGARQGIAKKTTRNALIRGSISGQPQEANWLTQLQTLLDEIPKYQPGADLDLLTRAYR